MKNIKVYESFRTEQEIKNLCSKYRITDYQIRDDGSIDVNTNVNLGSKLGDLKKLPLIFNEVKGYHGYYGYFDCNANNLTTLEGCPKEVSTWFACAANRITSLEHIPKKVGDDLFCYNNFFITSLEGLENTYISGKLDVRYCTELYSIKGFPKKVRNLDCSGTPIQPIYDTFIQEPDPEAISRFNRLRVIGTDGLDWWVYYDQLGKFLRSVDKEHLIMSEKDFDDFINTTKYRWDY
jgi:hypothetical protein